MIVCDFHELLLSLRKDYVDHLLSVVFGTLQKNILSLYDDANEF